MTMTILLPRGLKTMVDDEVYAELAGYRWHVSVSHYNYYALRRSSGGETVMMHRAIMNPPPRLHIDHINGDTLDNRRENLRFCTPRQNNMNRGVSIRNTSGYKGVSYHERDGAWKAEIRAEGKLVFIGYFDNPVDAAIAWNHYAMAYHGEFARFNDIPGWETVPVKNLALRSSNTSGYRGVRRKGDRWQSRIKVNGVEFTVGSYSDPIEAAVAYDTAARDSFGKKAILNFPEDIQK